MTGYIYKVTNKVNGKVYIGQTIQSVKARWQRHCNTKNKSKGEMQMQIKRAILKYGKEKYTNNEMYWIGYLYRYFSYTYELSSYRVYKMVKPKELRNLYLPYHTLSVEQAIERILEAKNIQLEVDDIHKQLEIYKKIRKFR